MKIAFIGIGSVGRALSDGLSKVGKAIRQGFYFICLNGSSPEPNIRKMKIALVST